MTCLKRAFYRPRRTVGGVESFSLLSVCPGCRVLAKSVTPRTLFPMPRDNCACSAVVRKLRACIIVYMLYFRIRRRLTSCRLAHCMQNQVKSSWPWRIALRPHRRLPQPFAFAGPTRSPPFLSTLCCWLPFLRGAGRFLRAVATRGPSHGTVTTPHAWEDAHGLWGRWSQGLNLSAPI